MIASLLIRFAASLGQLFMGVWAGVGLPQIPQSLVPILILWLVFFIFFLWQEWWKFTWWRAAVMPPRFEINRNEIMLGGLKVRFAYNDKNLSIATPDGKVAMVIDRSCVTNAKVDEEAAKKHPLGNWWFGDQGCPPVKISIGDGRHASVLWIYGGSFEHFNNPKAAATNFANGL